MGAFLVVTMRLGRRCAYGLVHHNADTRQHAECLVDHRSDLFPFEASQAAAERGYGDGRNATLPHLFHQRFETGPDVFDPALTLPVSLGREIDDVPRILQLIRIEHQHHARMQLSPVANRLVGVVVLRKLLAELQRDAAPHDPHTVHRVDQGLSIRLEDVALLKLDHWFLP